jgi:hypothetical protein
MGVLPTSRIESHGANSPIKSTTVDAIQDAIIGAKRSAAFPPQEFPKFLTVSGTWNWSTAGTLYIISAAAAKLLMPAPMSKGDRITGVNIQVFGDGAADATFTLMKSDTVQAITNLCTGTDTNRSAAWATLSLASLGAFTTTTLGDREAISLLIDTNAANTRIGNVQWLIDRL